MSFGVTCFLSTQKKLQVLQKKVIRGLSRSDFSAPTRPLFRCHGILRLPVLNTYHNACTMYRVISKLKSKLCELFPICFPPHTHNARNKYNIDNNCWKKRRLKTANLIVVCYGPQIWNQFDAYLKSAQSLSNFKRKLETEL